MEGVDKLLYGLFITALGMGVVFLVLLLLRYVIELMRVVFAPKKQKADIQTIVEKVEQPVEVENKASGIDENELIAVITAAVAACLGGNRDLIVRSITRVGDSSPVWSRTGRQDQMLTRF